MDGSGYRAFGEIDNELDASSTVPIPTTNFHNNIVNHNNIPIINQESILEKLREDIIGIDDTFNGPYGEKPILYCDWTASGRCLKSIENYIQNEVLPLYGNTHTTTSITGHQSTCFRDEARKIVAQCTNAKITGRASEDLVLFTGNGTTGAINKLILALGLHIPLPANYTENDRPVVFVSQYEHHSNLLTWRETVAQVVIIQYHASTGVCLIDLEKKLREHSSKKLLIGAFSAASNVTGILSDVLNISITMHRAGGLVFFDYATAAPYCKIDMNPTIVGADSIYAYIDAIYFSGHKFLGGPGSPGVLVVKTKVLPPQDTVPTEPGGGTVFYVTDGHHRYLSNKVEREESGTPNLIGDVKLGLVMHLQSTLNTAWIEVEEARLSAYIQSKLEKIDRLVLLGRRDIQGRHLPIFSFLIRSADRFLHYNFVCALLNDLFGIQTRGGCSCAGPMSQDILGISDEANRSIELALLDKHEVLRPGYTRLSFPFWMDSASLDFVLQALTFVAQNGWVFLPSYKYNPKTGEWAHLTRMTKFPERKWLSNFSLLASTAQDNARDGTRTGVNYQEVTHAAAQELAVAKSCKELQYRVRQEHPSSDGRETTAVEALRWFCLLSDVTSLSAVNLLDLHCVFDPSKWTGAERVVSAQTSGISVVQGTVYAQQRANGKLTAHSAHSAPHETSRLPRYLTLMGNNKAPTDDDIRDTEQHSSFRLDGGAVLHTAVVTGEVQSEYSFVSAYTEERELDTQPSNSPSATATTAAICSVNANTEAGAMCAPREKPVDGRLLPGQGLVFDAAMSTNGLKVTPVDPPKKIMKLVGQAIKDWAMIQDGDRLLLGLSGGKDSLALLHILIALQRRAPVRFEIACCTVDPQTASFDPSSLIPYVKSLGITYHYMSEPIIELAKTKMQGDSLCAFCARFKRGLLYSTCRTHGYNKLVLAQHLDDLAESFYMSLNHNGKLRTMKANYAIDAGDVRVIRPLVYVRETATRDFSKFAKLPVVNENCPACFEEPKERARVKKILQQEEAMVPALFFNLRKALLPLMHERTYEVMNEVDQSIAALGSSTVIVKRSRNNETQVPVPCIEGEALDDADVDDDEREVKKPKNTQLSNSVSIEPSLASMIEDPSQLLQSSSAICTDDYCVPCYELM